jgi:hypothetical protein
MPKHKLKTQSLKATRYRKHIIAVVFVAVFAFLGVIILSSSHASGPYASVEASSGSLTGSAASVVDGSASNGSYVQFGTSSGGSGASSSGGCEYNQVVAPCVGSATTAVSGWGTPVFDDEFNESSLKAPWTTGWFDSSTPSGPVNGAEYNCYDPSFVTLGSSGLDLEFMQGTETCKGVSQSYTAGLVTTDPFDGSHGSTTGLDPSVVYPGPSGSNTNTGYTFSYGFVEAKVYLPPSGSEIANWPAVWATTPPPNSSGNPTYNEMDMLEGLSGQACYHLHSNSGGPGNCASGNYSGWHTFAGDWEPPVTNSSDVITQPAYVTYYYDGKDVGTITNACPDNSTSCSAICSLSSTCLAGVVTAGPMYLILNNSDGSDGGPTTTPTNMLIRYVRVWQK